jgi:hypothetical protein
MFNELVIDTEQTSSIIPVKLEHSGSFIFNGGAFQSDPNTCSVPDVVVDSNNIQGITFNNAAFILCATAPQVIHFLSASGMANPIHCRNCTVNSAAMTTIDATIPITDNYTFFLRDRNTPAHLATFGTCNAGLEGTYQTQDDSAVACVAGVTAANGGTTHCGIYCNGSLWKRTGL